MQELLEQFSAHRSAPDSWGRAYRFSALLTLTSDPGAQPFVGLNSHRRQRHFEIVEGRAFQRFSFEFFENFVLFVANLFYG